MNEKIEYIALAQKVLAVAVKKYKENNILFDWAVYIDAVNGINHNDEKGQVAKIGCKQGKEFAVFLFPHLDADFYRS